jgi:hypothetical protein
MPSTPYRITNRQVPNEKVGDTIADPNADAAERSQAIAKFRALRPLVRTPIRLVAVAIPGKAGKGIPTSRYFLMDP